MASFTPTTNIKHTTTDRAVNYKYKTKNKPMQNAEATPKQDMNVKSEEEDDMKILRDAGVRRIGQLL